MRPVAEWDEDFVLSLPVDESDKLERKGTQLLDLSAGADESKVRDELAKQLSAFANTGGGQIIYGLRNNGSVDSGGISDAVRGSMKEWIEDLIPTLTDLEVVGVNVCRVRKSCSPKTAQEKSLYIVDVPDSDRAPHQSVRDHLYYVRFGGKSRPASHRLIEDIRNRIKHPNVTFGVSLETLRFFGAETPPSSFRLAAALKIRLQNEGALMSRNTCFHLFLDVPDASVCWHDQSIVRRFDDGANKGRAHFWELVGPLYPGMNIDFTIDLNFPVGFSHAAFTNAARFPDRCWITTENKDITDAICKWTVFAENASPTSGQCRLRDLSFNAHVKCLIDTHPRALQISQMCGRIPE